MGGSDASTGPGGGGPALRAAGRRAGGASFTPCASRPAAGRRSPLRKAELG